MKTDAQINEQIVKLKEIAPRLVPYSAFGDDNLAAHAAVIGVLKNLWDVEDVEARFGADALAESDEGFDEHTFGAALNASDWLYDLLAEGEQPPAEGWPLRKLIEDPYSGR